MVGEWWVVVGVRWVSGGCKVVRWVSGGWVGKVGVRWVGEWRVVGCRWVSGG